MVNMGVRLIPVRKLKNVLEIQILEMKIVL